MTSKHGSALFALLVAAVPLLGQQTGTIVSTTPGSAVGKRLQAVGVQRPRPTCGSVPANSGMPALPEMVYTRMMDYLVCLRHADGSSEKLLNGGPWMVLSPDGNDLAYWVPEKHELHVFSIVDHTDTIVDALPETTMGKIIWSSKGRILTYLLNGVTPPGARVLDLDSGRRQIPSTVLSGVTSTLDGEHMLAVGVDGVERVNIGDGRRELVATVKYAASAEYSRSGLLLGILASSVKETDAAVDDDEPDCTGGTFALFVQMTATRQLIQVPFPVGFDSVLDFAFSPDDRAIAVTFGAAACDYPGDVARVYLVSLPNLNMTPISPADRLSVKAQWSPDGKVVIYSDYTGGESPLVAVDVQTGKAIALTNASQDGPDEILGWRRNKTTN